MQNHFQDCPRYPLSCEKCGKENIPRNEVSSVLLERWHTLSELHLSGPHKWMVLFAFTDCLACRRNIKSFIIIRCSKKNWELSGLGYVIIIIIVIVNIFIYLFIYELINWLLVVHFVQQWVILVFLFSRCKNTMRKSVQGRSSSVLSALWAAHLRYT